VPIDAQAAQDAQNAVTVASERAITHINRFSRRVLLTRGGRVGSGMGTLLEGLWGYAVNRELRDQHGDRWELAWLADHEYNDFACVLRNQPWTSSTRQGELFRIEAKTMVTNADESKAHFDEPESRLGPFDLLFVLVWKWEVMPGERVQPVVEDHYIGPVKKVAKVRDALHMARGGTFVDRAQCPDGCRPDKCTHHGEPLNAAGKRERLAGPSSCRVSQQVSYAANFGGMVRMLKTNSADARKILRQLRATDPDVDKYVSFIYSSFPDEELNHYSIGEWRDIARSLNLETSGSKQEIAARVRAADHNYQQLMVQMFAPDS